MNEAESFSSNQYPVHRSLELRRTDYPSKSPHALAAQWRKKGWTAVEHRGQVRVYHGAESPRPLKDAAESLLLPVTAGDDTLQALNGALRRALSVADYTRRDADKYTMFASNDGRTHSTGIKWVKVYHHRTWTWTFDFQGDDCWFVPHPTWTKVTEETAQRAAVFLGSQGDVWTVLDGHTGETWPNLTAQEIKETDLFSASRFRIIYRPRTGSDEGSPAFTEIHAAVQGEPVFAQIAAVAQPRQLSDADALKVDPPRLVIGETEIAQRKETLQRGVHRRPDRPVRLVAVQPADDQEAHRILSYRFGKAGKLLPTTWVSQVWDTQWKLKTHSPMRWVKTSVKYDPTTGQLSDPDKLVQEADLAAQGGQTLVTVTVLPRKALPRSVMTALREAVRPFNHVFVTPEAYLPDKQKPEKKQRCWGVVTRLALKVLRAAGGLPYALKPLPGTTPGTYYLGLDLSSSHRENRSVLAVVLIDWLGHVIGKRVVPLDENNERIPTPLLTEMLPAWVETHSGIGEAGPAPQRDVLTRLIVHRDGQFMAQEAEELREAFGHLPQLDLVAVKKSSPLRVQFPSTEPRVMPLLISAEV